MGNFFFKGRTIKHEIRDIGLGKCAQTLHVISVFTQQIPRFFSLNVQYINWLLYGGKKEKKKQVHSAFFCILSESAAQRMLRLRRSEELKAER